MQRTIATIFAILTAMTVTACSSITPNFYKLDMRQGNVLEPEKVAQLQPGMSKRQVQNILGSPLLTDPFHQDRWDYIYAFYPRGNREKGEERHLILHFQGETLARIDGMDTIPPPSTPAPAPTGTSTAEQAQQPSFFQFSPPDTVSDASLSEEIDAQNQVQNQTQ